MATTPTPMPEAQTQPQAAISPFGRIFGILFSPGRTFADIAARPTWLAPLVFLTVINLALNVALVRKADWRSFAEEQIMNSPRGQQIPADQKDLAVERGAKGNIYFCYVRGALGVSFLALILTLVYWGAYALLGGARLTFGKSFAVIIFAMMPDALKMLLGIPILLLKDPSTLGNPYNFIGSNPAAFMDPNGAKWLLALLTSLDIFVIWAVILTALGFHYMDPKKLSVSKSLGIVASVYVFFTLLGVTIAWVFS